MEEEEEEEEEEHTKMKGLSFFLFFSIFLLFIAFSLFHTFVRIFNEIDRASTRARFVVVVVVAANSTNERPIDRPIHFYFN